MEYCRSLLSFKLKCLLKFVQLSPRKAPNKSISLFCRQRYYKGIIFGYQNGVMWCVMTLHVLPLLNQINEDNRRLILNQERPLFSFSETSFEKQCHKGFNQSCSAGESGLQYWANLHLASQFARVANVHVLNVAKNGGTAKEYVSCNVAIRMIFGGTGERTISCFNIWSISAYAIVNSLYRK